MKRWILSGICSLAIFVAASGHSVLAQYGPAEGPLMTRWASDVAPETVHAEYPRPQMARDTWLNLNGLWDFAVRPWREDMPSQWDGKILVPFAIESALSGVMREVGP